MLASRRGFITGLSALFVAPAIVRADSLMKIRPMYYDRFLMVYMIGTDQLIARADRAQFELPTPRGTETFTMAEFELNAPAIAKVFKSLKPGPYEQLNVGFEIDMRGWHTRYDQPAVVGQGAALLMS